MFKSIPSLAAAWPIVSEQLWKKPSLLTRQARLPDYLRNLHISVYRFKKAGVIPFFRPGVNTTLFRTAEIASWELSLVDQAVCKHAILPYVEKILVGSLIHHYGPEIHRKDLATILDSEELTKWLIDEKELRPALQAKRQVLFRIGDIYRVILSIEKRRHSLVHIASKYGGGK